MVLTENLKAEIGQTMADLLSNEPIEVSESTPFTSDVLEENGDNRLAAWEITYSTHHNPDVAGPC
ncbi:hypothetical protein P3102_18965 [Amycolatopsis sp. QT-25]|uniref:hypothetical protein n=1 Tax=Amycolatopsis sp. QT-25 TaxID=3034022 RepID=UPI0023EDB0B5|nr:hypothetical protein [Amycolatopsis sp. QT-25]WET76220.1 hypothetical protein P3102_18965 [Amycolatopsis sp. QT-25]